MSLSKQMVCFQVSFKFKQNIRFCPYEKQYFSEMTDGRYCSSRGTQIDCNFYSAFNDQASVN